MNLAGHGAAGRLVLTNAEAAILARLFETMFPDDGDGFGAVAMGAVDFVDRALDGHEAEDLPLYRRTLAWAEARSRARFGRGVVALSEADAAALVGEIERGGDAPAGAFALLRRDLMRGLFADPVHGGNRDRSGWRFLGHPGPGVRYAAEDHLAEADLSGHEHPPSPGPAAGGLPDAFDPDAGRADPVADADVVIAGAGAVGAMVAARLAGRGLRVVVLEAGPWRHPGSFRPDELAQAFYGRAGLGAKFNQEVPRWVRREDETEDRPLSFSLGRMANGVGGSTVLYGARFRRFHPHHLRHLSSIHEQGLAGRLPEGAALADWPVSYDELEPYYCELEGMIGVAGEASPYTPRSAPLPYPPLRPFRAGVLFCEAARALGYRPHAIPVGRVGEPRDGIDPRYDPWDEGIGAVSPERWTPMRDLLPEALATGNLALRTECRVLRVVTDRHGRALGLRYLDPDGREKLQKARAVILAAYTFETVRLLAMSGTDAAPDGLGNRHGQLGRYFMAKMFPQVVGAFDGRFLNRHTGPGGQAVIVEDLIREGVNLDHGPFLGGGTLSTENQLLPLQIALDPAPLDAPRWGPGLKAHLKSWNRRVAVKVQADAMPMAGNRLLLDPRRRDRSGIGDPVLRVVWDLCDNDRQLYDFMQARAEALLAEMGADRIGRGPVETGVGCCHDLGGCRAGDDPAGSVVDRRWQVHDTPGLHVFSGATFPTCPGINPTLTIWAWALRNADHLAKDLGAEEIRS